MSRIYIKDIATYIPQDLVSNERLQDQLKSNGYTLPENMIHRLMGSEKRFYAAKDEQCSDLAVAAARQILDRNQGLDIDLLIFAAASSDMIEPATSAIVQHKLGLHCAAFDVKNACNSVTNAIEIASSLISQGNYHQILIVSGEKTSDSILFDGLNKDNIKDHFASFSFGDAGVAILLSSHEEESGFLYHRQKTFGQHWSLCQIPGGGSMYPHSPEKMYFQGDTFGLKSAIEEECPEFVRSCLMEANLNMDDIEIICTHQVSMVTYRDIAKGMGINTDKIIQTFPLYGNTAASSLPLALHHAFNSGRLKKGDLILLLGLAAGINVSVQIYRY